MVELGLRFLALAVVVERHAVAAADRIDDGEACFRNVETLTTQVGDMAAIRRELTKLTLRAGKACNSAADRGARAGMFDRNSCAGGVAVVGVGLPVTTADRIHDVGTTRRTRPARALISASPDRLAAIFLGRAGIIPETELVADVRWDEATMFETSALLARPEVPATGTLEWAGGGERSRRIAVAGVETFFFETGTVRFLLDMGGSPETVVAVGEAVTAAYRLEDLGTEDRYVHTDPGIEFRGADTGGKLAELP